MIAAEQEGFAHRQVLGAAHGEPAVEPAEAPADGAEGGAGETLVVVVSAGRRLPERAAPRRDSRGGWEGEVGRQDAGSPWTADWAEGGLSMLKRSTQPSFIYSS